MTYSSNIKLVIHTAGFIYVLEFPYEVSHGHNTDGVLGNKILRMIREGRTIEKKELGVDEEVNVSFKVKEKYIIDN